MNPLAAPEWRHSDSPVDYETAITEMSERVDAIRRDGVDEQVWLLEHPPLYTAGTSAGDGDLLEPDLFPVHRTGRGGEFTYHGPGQRVAYVMLDLERRGKDVRCYVHHLEEWIILALGALNVEAKRIPGRVGVWAPRPDKGKDRHDKIAAVGVRVRRWVTWHGVSINVSPDLDHYRGIVPCGIRDDGVTSLEDLGQIVSMAEFDSVLRTTFAQVFGVPLGCHDG